MLNHFCDEFAFVLCGVKLFALAFTVIMMVMMTIAHPHYGYLAVQYYDRLYCARLCRARLHCSVPSSACPFLARVS